MSKQNSKGVKEKSAYETEQQNIKRNYSQNDFLKVQKSVGKP